MKNLRLNLINLCAFAVFCFLGCEKNDKNTNDPELITTIQLSFIDSASGVIRAAIFSDPDGDGGAEPTQFDTIKLAANRTYFTSIVLLDESNPSQVDTISNEVLEERNDHQFFFHSHSVNLAISYLDHDDNGLPIGIETRWVSGAASSGEAHVTLKHQPGVKDGTDDPGDTDIDIEFPIRIE